MIKALRLIYLMLVGALFTLPAATSALDQSETKLLILARDSAIIAGGAKYCKLDPELIEDFIARTEARLSVLAKDEYEKVLARLEFKNILDTYTVRAPDQKCDEFALSFERARQNLQ